MRIGVFDSGIGGITVLSELQLRLKNTDFIYLGDTAHVPYGTKSPEQIEKLSLKCAQILKKKKIDALVVACNTASSLALGAIQRALDPIPVLGMVEPGVRSVTESLLNSLGSDPSEAASALNPRHSPSAAQKPQAPPSVLVLATRATVRSGAYGRALAQALPQARIFEQACPLLVPFIEEGWIDHPLLHETLRVYLEPYLSHTPGIALLGCTHYPWIEPAFQKALPGWRIIHSARAVAQTLEKTQWLQKPTSRPSQKPTSIEWIFTDPAAVSEFAQGFIQTLNSAVSAH
ncbi:MAG: glutamate racemase [Bdellovibrionia bacterium]